MAKKNAPAPVATPAVLETAPAEARRAYLLEKVDEATGEVTQVPRFRYLPGHPRQIRFDAKAGQFNINGVAPLGNALRFIPLAWRIFQDDILNMGRKLWAELFYADEKGAICAVLFHGYSVENLYRLIEPLFYDDLTLADVVVKAQASKKETTKDGKKATYYIAEFSYEPADPAEVQARREFARDFPIWRQETHTGTADVRIQHGYTVPIEAEAATEQVEETQQAA
ncbi:hypothetical protein [Hymenobacter latericus]|uniref:hypothetical protein n=1 Tax=Hymenobacter sp. YIM 151858-1 TaxID=2987688 RepID=UPI0022278E45|nr:hypothetical protein [Hymenobacter sp. YIM 151858-1]UYZ58045.1 hypothetical protein OIS50_13370 [Hymenobacter sp. YIM 151858-1]